jgi:hypothetical protein
MSEHLSVEDRLSLMGQRLAAIEVRWPRVRGLEVHFDSQGARRIGSVTPAAAVQ